MTGRNSTYSAVVGTQASPPALARTSRPLAGRLWCELKVSLDANTFKHVARPTVTVEGFNATEEAG
ncbi:hypothetical protein FKP32DRAFT_1587087, partial [Trametes sanguinea]